MNIYNEEYERSLVPWASRSKFSLGRSFFEIPPETRSEFQRDRDRIIHSKAFRRLEYKTQVFVNHEGDLFRTRLTHTIEVAQIARSLARNLKINEDLVEAIALAHDLGHTPFGHAGQDALNICMKNYGGFEHNLQSLRVVDLLEKRYVDFDGLNLMFETREGILKHCSKVNAENLGKVGERFLKKKQPSLEAQVANLADEVAYNNHDIDDGFRSGLISISQLKEVDLFSEHYYYVKKKYPGIEGRVAVYEVIRKIINTLVLNIIEKTKKNLIEENINTIDDVRNSKFYLVNFSESYKKKADELKSFLRKNLYHHYQVNRMTNKAYRIITDLFEIFFSNPSLLPKSQTFNFCNKNEKARYVADYIAGMTDRFAMREHRKLFAVDEI